MGYPLQFLIYKCWNRNLFFSRQLLIWLPDEKLGLLEGITEKSACWHSKLNFLSESCLIFGICWVTMNAYWEMVPEKKKDITDRHFQENSSLATDSPPGGLKFWALSCKITPWELDRKQICGLEFCYGNNSFPLSEGHCAMNWSEAMFRLSIHQGVTDWSPAVRDEGICPLEPNASAQFLCSEVEWVNKEAQLVPERLLRL